MHTTRKTSSFPDARGPGLCTAWTLSTSPCLPKAAFQKVTPGRAVPSSPSSCPQPSSAPFGARPAWGLRGRAPSAKPGQHQEEWIPAETLPGGAPHPRGGLPQTQPHHGRPAPAVPVLPATGGPLRSLSGRDRTQAHSCWGAFRPRWHQQGRRHQDPLCSQLSHHGRQRNPIKSEPLPKPPASAPPSILVKPENSRNGSEKQVKTVRFQNYSPPPTKHHTSHPGSGKPEQPAAPKGPQPEAAASGPEMTVLFAHRSGCHSGQQTDLRRKSAFSKTTTPVPTASATQTVFPSK
uniref:Uncharacterized protein n=1 Tax=Sus scrofa TaxID=9823 RepID=A0A4X1SUM1_PIG